MKAKILVAGVLIAISCALWGYNIRWLVRSGNRASGGLRGQLLADFKLSGWDRPAAEEKKGDKAGSSPDPGEIVRESLGRGGNGAELTEGGEALLKDEPGVEKESPDKERPAEKHWTEEFSAGEEGLTIKVDETRRTNENRRSRPVISYEELYELNKRVSILDKAKAMKILLPKLGPSDIKLLKAMLSGGVTTEEIKKAKEMVEGRLTEQEKKELDKLYRKYIAAGLD